MDVLAALNARPGGWSISASVAVEREAAGADRMLAGQREGRPPHEARARRLDHEARDAPRARARLGLHVHDRDVGLGGVGDPGLLAVDPPAAGDTRRARGDRGEVGARARLGERGAPDRTAGHQGRHPALGQLGRSLARELGGDVAGVDQREREAEVGTGQHLRDPRLGAERQAEAAMRRGHLDAAQAERRSGLDRLATDAALALPEGRAGRDHVAGEDGDGGIEGAEGVARTGGEGIGHAEGAGGVGRGRIARDGVRRGAHRADGTRRVGTGRGSVPC
jgi:hypothetical protein